MGGRREQKKKNLLSLPIPLTGHVHVSQDVERTALLNATWGWRDNSLQDIHTARVKLGWCWRRWRWRKNREEWKGCNAFDGWCLTCCRGGLKKAAWTRRNTPYIILAIHDHCESRWVYGHGGVWKRVWASTIDIRIPHWCVYATSTKMAVLLSGYKTIHIITPVVVKCQFNKRLSLLRYMTCYTPWTYFASIHCAFVYHDSYCQEAIIKCSFTSNIINQFTFTFKASNQERKILYYFEFKMHLFDIFPNWKLGCILNSRNYFSLSGSLKNIISL